MRILVNVTNIWTYHIYYFYIFLEPQQIVAATVARETETAKGENISYNMEESKDYINYLEDDSTSSPLIPLDVISENGIKRKLNFLQLNEALNSGRIQLFPNGPRTPNTDRKARSQQRFWHGLGDERPLEADIKPRGTLNFNESIMMSPGPALKVVKPIRNNRFSQADELMLDNTNFLVHAKVGDETNSRNSSKCASRRETTYNNTTMELDNLEKDEAAVVAALERVTRAPPTLQRMEEMDVSDIEPKQNIQASVQKNQKLDHTMRLNETMEEEYVPPPDTKSTRTKQKVGDSADNVIEERAWPAASAGEQEYVISRKSLHFTKDISGVDEDLQLTSKRQEEKSRRQTLHMIEPMDEDSNESQSPMATSKVEQSFSRAASVKSLHNKHRKTIHQAEPIEEDIVKPLSELKVQSTGNSVFQQHSVRRQTLLLTVPIEEDINETKESHSPVTQPNCRRRQTMHMAIAIEEDLVKQQSGSARKPIGPLEAAQQSIKRRDSVHMAVDMEEEFAASNEELQSASTATASTEHSRMRRHTVYIAEAIEEDAINPQKEVSLKETTSEAAPQITRRRETLHIPEPIEEELVESPIVAAASQSNRHRQTLHMENSMEEDKLCLNPTSFEIEQSTRRRETLHMAEDIKEEVIRPQGTRHRKTLYMSEAIEEDYIGTQQQQQLNSKRRETLHMVEDIKEEIARQVSPEPFPSVRHSQTLNKAEPIEEDLVRPQKAPPAIQRDYRYGQTIHMTEPKETLHMIEDTKEEKRPQELIKNRKASTTVQENSKRRETVHKSEDNEQDVLRLKKECNLKTTAYPAPLRCGRRRETLHLNEDIEEDMVKPIAECNMKSTAYPVQLQIDSRRETLHVTEDMEEEFLTPKKECSIKSTAHPVLLQNGRRRETLHKAEAMEEDSFCLPKELAETAGAFTDLEPSTNSKLPNTALKCSFRQASGISDSFAVNKINTQNVIKPKTMPEEDFNRKSRQTLHLTKPIEEEMCTSASTYMAQSVGCQDHYAKPRKTITMPEAIVEDFNSFAKELDSPVKKPRQAILPEEPIDEEIPNSPIIKRDGGKSKLAFLKCMGISSPDNNNTEHEVLVQSVLSQEIKNKEQSPEKNKNPSIARIIMETPKVNKTQHNFFPITPGRSMIEYEDLEEICNADSEIRQSAVASKITNEPVDMDMNISSCGTPKPMTTSFNIKRLPIHLTPNLPEAKKRNVRLPTAMDDHKV